jgi:hypothetical protein
VLGVWRVRERDVREMKEFWEMDIRVGGCECM